jgi:general stress protein 26
MEPIPSRPRIPAVYGVPTHEDNLLSWSYVTGCIAAAKHYWLATVTPSGTPHARPFDGMWLDDRLYFGGSPESKWRRNLSNNSAASVHLEDAAAAIILEGNAGIVRPDAALADRLVAASNAKYDMGQKREQYVGLPIVEFVPKTVFGWKVLYEDATRWRLE